MKHLIAGLVLALTSQTLIAQKAPIKFGDIPIEDLKMVTHPKDSSASALILTDFGQSSLVYSQSDGFSLLFERITRIKILSKDGLDWATFSIPLYKDGGANEKLSGLKGATYNLENNKVVETKMKNDAVFKEKATENLDVVKVTLPGVKVGSVVEISYKVMSDFLFHFQDWEFQSTIPARWSEYRANIPEYYNYDKYTQGYIPLTVVEEADAPSSITLTSSERESARGFGAVKTEFTTDRIEFKEKRSRWVAQDVPAFKAEPFITTPKDYILKINFELAYKQFPGRPIEPIMGSWADLNKQYSESEHFGKEITGNGFLKKTVEEITAGLSAPEQKISAINNYVARNIEWNGYSYKFTDAPFRKILDEKKGSSADINLLLGSMLEKAGFDVSPVLLSTRDHGFVRETVPISSQFNYVVCLVRLNEKMVLLDATDKLLPTGTLPERCLNGNGFVVAKDGAFTWVPLKSPAKSRKYYSADLVAGSSGELRGKFSVDQSGYYAQLGRKKFLAKGEGEYVKEMIENRSWVVEKSEFKNAKEISEGFKESYDVVISDHATATDGLIYINPFIDLQEKENPFKLEKREYPVDYGSPLEKLYMCKISIPDGYTVDELPKSVMLKLPENSARYVYNVTQNGNTISLTSNLQINKSLFTQDEYPHLREFYTQLVAKQAEQIVLKKK
jgi:Transglutaminase-like superfamily